MQHFLAGSRVVQLACVVHNNNSGIALNIAINSRKLTARTTGRGNLIYFSFLIENPARTITYFPASALSLSRGLILKQPDIPLRLDSSLSIRSFCGFFYVWIRYHIKIPRGLRVTLFRDWWSAVGRDLKTLIDSAQLNISRWHQLITQCDAVSLFFFKF